MIPTISLCMIVKNEENTLDFLLDGISNFVDEIIMVDTGSTDKTKEIAKKYTDKVYDFNWNDDFSSARNYSLSKATMDWVLVLDSDEYLPIGTQKELRVLLNKLNKDSNPPVVSLKRVKVLCDYKQKKSSIRIL